MFSLILVCFLLFLDPAQPDPCSCKNHCIEQLKPLSQQEVGASSPQTPVFVFDIIHNSCIEHSSACQPNATCTFANKTQCEGYCLNKVKNAPKYNEDPIHDPKDEKKGDNCVGFKHGCCPDGTARRSNGRCYHHKGVDGMPESSSHDRVAGDRVRWDLVVSGASVMVIMVMVLSVTGVVTYRYKKKMRERERSHFIRDVLEMYNSDSDSSCSDGGRENGLLKNDYKKHLIIEL